MSYSNPQNLNSRAFFEKLQVGYPVPSWNRKSLSKGELLNEAKVACGYTLPMCAGMTVARLFVGIFEMPDFKLSGCDGIPWYTVAYHDSPW